MAKRNKNFIGERLSELTENTHDGSELEPPAELEVRAHALAQANALPPKTKTQTNRKKKFWICFAPTASAVLCAVLCCVFLIPHKSAPSNGEPAFFYDVDLTAKSITYNELTESFDILMPNIEIDESTHVIHNYNKTNRPIYASLSLHAFDGTMTINVTFVNNYNIADFKFYENLPNKETTDLVEYEYRVIKEAGKAFAKFEYKGYRYYIDYTSDYPEGITYIMSTLEMK